ncbi:Ran-binding 9 [Hyphodiscus hymeniophilus]|uniref:Ran-binding 9 n=1 Tax=Hyphodiscus hymeniophilus TaxID=353542 RepID=A0A9P6SNE9_9HELO|nr:Ran-binding 9 [Hyphodiscus hymeniophilus]
MTNSYPHGSPGVPDTGMPTGAPGLMPRRSSYASVVSGAASALSQQYQPSRSGAFANLLNHPDFAYETSPQNPASHSRYDPRNFDMDYNTNGSGRGRSWSGGRGGQLPSWSSAFGSLTNGPGYGEFGGGHLDTFFIPSYLKDSKYVQKLEEAHKAKVLAHKDGPSAHSSQPGSLSTSASSMSLHTKVVPSHRGMTYDSYRMDKKSNSRARMWYLLFRGHNHITQKRRVCSIGIGFSSKSVPLSRLPGWEPESWAYHGDDGNSFCCQTSGKHYGPPFTAGDIIGCGVNFRTGSAFFTKNGDHLGTAFREIRGKLFPSVGMKKTGEHIRSPFVFDIDGMMSYRSLNAQTDKLSKQDEKKQIRMQIEATSTAKLAPKLNETELIQKLVLQFLQHDGYVETARAFAEEVHAEKKALSLDANAIISGFDVKEDEDAGHRQHGDVEKALKHTNAFYPHVLKDNEHVYFRLRCLKFIEMTRQGAELLKHTNSASNGIKKANGHNYYEEYVDHGMELDDQSQNNNNWDKMDTEDSTNNQAEYDRLMGETLLYGRDLAAEFKDDPRREVKKALEDIFALMAYKDPFSSKDVSHLLDPSGRVAVAEELNSAILLSLGKSSSAALEQLYQQTTVLLEDLREGGGPGAFVNIDDYANPDKPLSRF